MQNFAARLITKQPVDGRREHINSPRSPGAKTKKKNTNSTQNKSQTHRAKQYEVTSFPSTDCELSTDKCSKDLCTSLVTRSPAHQIQAPCRGLLFYCCLHRLALSYHWHKLNVYSAYSSNSLLVKACMDCDRIIQHRLYMSTTC